MTTTVPHTGRQLRSTVRANGTLEVSVADVPVPPPGVDEVVVRMEAAPINPSDLGLLFGPANLAAATYSGTAERPMVVAPIPEAAMRALAARVDVPTPVGNEGAGVVVAAGESPEAQALLGKTVAMVGGAMYSQYRVMKAQVCLVLPPDVTPAEGASCFVNPLTALGMVETMRREGHTALVHTAAASNLGQMLNKICLKDGIALVNIVRRPEQAELLRGLGARHVCDTSSPLFAQELVEALLSTGATIAFDATGGGMLAGQILTAMEAAAVAKGAPRTVYGTAVHKQVYIYGRLEQTPTSLTLGPLGFAWSVSGWLLFPFLSSLGQERTLALRARVVAELKTTFASHYTQTVSLAGALQPEAIAIYGKRATGEKFLINPSL